MPHAPAAPGVPRSGHAQSVAGAPAHVTTHIGKHVAPHNHPCRKPVHNRCGEPIMVAGGPAHSRPYASTLAVPNRKHVRVIAGWPHMIQIQTRSSCCIVCLAGIVALRTAGNMLAHRRPCQKAIQSARGAHEHETKCLPNVHLALCFFHTDGGGAHRVGCACSEFGGRVCFVVCLFVVSGMLFGEGMFLVAFGSLGEGCVYS